MGRLSGDTRLGRLETAVKGVGVIYNPSVPQFLNVVLANFPSGISEQ
jgi:hypothetical protein